MTYPHEMLRTIARSFYIRPTEYIQSGFDWTPMNDKWEKLSEEERQPWFDMAIVWLNSWKKQSPDLFNYYMNNWYEDMNSDGFLSLISIKPITL